ncbi:MAG: hypothetical protein ABIH50_04840 [bacterium]
MSGISYIPALSSINASSRMAAPANDDQTSSPSSKTAEKWIPTFLNGIFPGQPFDLEVLQKADEEAGLPYNAVIIYVQLSRGYETLKLLEKMCATAHQAGKAVFLKFEPWTASEEAIYLSAMDSDAHDLMIYALNKTLNKIHQDLPELVMMATFAHEMDSPFYPWSLQPSLFCKVFERMVRLLPNFLTWVANSHAGFPHLDYYQCLPTEAYQAVALDWFERDYTPIITQSFDPLEAFQDDFTAFNSCQESSFTAGSYCAGLATTATQQTKLSPAACSHLASIPMFIGEYSIHADPLKYEEARAKAMAQARLTFTPWGSKAFKLTGGFWFFQNKNEGTEKKIWDISRPASQQAFSYAGQILTQQLSQRNIDPFTPFYGFNKKRVSTLSPREFVFTGDLQYVVKYNIAVDEKILTNDQVLRDDIIYALKDRLVATGLVYKTISQEWENLFLTASKTEVTSKLKAHLGLDDTALIQRLIEELTDYLELEKDVFELKPGHLQYLFGLSIPIVVRNGTVTVENFHQESFAVKLMSLEKIALKDPDLGKLSPEYKEKLARILAFEEKAKGKYHYLDNSSTMIVKGKITGEELAELTAIFNIEGSGDTAKLRLLKSHADNFVRSAYYNYLVRFTGTDAEAKAITAAKILRAAVEDQKLATDFGINDYPRYRDQFYDFVFREPFEIRLRPNSLKWWDRIILSEDDIQTMINDMPPHMKTAYAHAPDAKAKWKFFTQELTAKLYTYQLGTFASEFSYRQLQELQEALPIRTRDSRLELFLERGKAYFQIGRFAEAEKEFDEIINSWGTFSAQKPQFYFEAIFNRVLCMKIRSFIELRPQYITEAIKLLDDKVINDTNNFGYIARAQREKALLHFAMLQTEYFAEDLPLVNTEREKLVRSLLFSLEIRFDKNDRLAYKEAAYPQITSLSSTLPILSPSLLIKASEPFSAELYGAHGYEFPLPPISGESLDLRGLPPGGYSLQVQPQSTKQIYRWPFIVSASSQIKTAKIEGEPKAFLNIDTDRFKPVPIRGHWNYKTTEGEAFEIAKVFLQMGDQFIFPSGEERRMFDDKTLLRMYNQAINWFKLITESQFFNQRIDCKCHRDNIAHTHEPDEFYLYQALAHRGIGEALIAKYDVEPKPEHLKQAIEHLKAATDKMISFKTKTPMDFHVFNYEERCAYVQSYTSYSRGLYLFSQLSDDQTLANSALNQADEQVDSLIYYYFQDPYFIPDKNILVDLFITKLEILQLRYRRIMEGTTETQPHDRKTFDAKAEFHYYQEMVENLLHGEGSAYGHLQERYAKLLDLDKTPRIYDYQSQSSIIKNDIVQVKQLVGRLGDKGGRERPCTDQEIAQLLARFEKLSQRSELTSDLYLGAEFFAVYGDLLLATAKVRDDYDKAIKSYTKAIKLINKIKSKAAANPRLVINTQALDNQIRLIDQQITNATNQR